MGKGKEGKSGRKRDGWLNSRRVINWHDNWQVDEARDDEKLLCQRESHANARSRQGANSAVFAT
jgi:hypothetical protein